MTHSNTVTYLAYAEDNLSFMWERIKAAYFLLHYVCLKQRTGYHPGIFYSDNT